MKNIPGMEDFASTVLLPPSPNFDLEDKRSVIPILFFPLKIFEKKKKNSLTVLSFCCTCTRLKSSLPLVLWSLLLLLPSCQACLCIATHLLLLLLAFPCSTLLLHFGQKPLLCVCVCVCEKRCIYQCGAVL